jgi:hypothetical protein
MALAAVVAPPPAAFLLHHVSDEAAPFEAQLVVPPVRNGECKK